MKHFSKLAYLAIGAFVALFCLSGGIGSLNFLPQQPNQLRIPVSAWTGLTEDEFNRTIANFARYYAPVLKQKGITLKIQNLWEDETPNSVTYPEGKSIVINAYGGLARFDGMTADGYTLVLCHEIGHHLGGFPSYPDSGWMASSEGQSDYFASLKCFRKLYKSGLLLQDPNQGYPREVEDKCESAWQDVGDQELCKRNMMAGFSTASVLNALNEGKKPVSFRTPDPRQVSKMFYGHPEAQCRLDTYMAAAMCNASERVPMSFTDVKKGACSIEGGSLKQWSRPLCWYKPQGSILDKIWDIFS